MVAIDGPAGAGKTTVGVWLASRLGVPFIESGYFFRGLAAARDGAGALARVDVEAQVPPNDDWRPRLRVDGRIVEELRSPELEQRLAALVRKGDVRSSVARRVRELAGVSGGVVVGRRTALESCADAAARVSMTASEEIRAERRRRADGADVPAGRYLARMKAREPEESDNSSYTLSLDTSEMSVTQVRNTVMEHVRERMAP